MRLRRTVEVVVVVVTVFVAVHPVGAQADDTELGREVYDDFCVSCHGRDMVAPGGG